MVHKSTDSRLLNNLISHEKEYSKHLHALLDSSHASFNSLTVFAASSPPPTSQVILAIAGSLNSVDDALRGYVAAVERWREYLADLKDLEDEVGNILRDRDILVTRLLKASSKSKLSSNKDSLLVSPSSSTLNSTEDPTMSYAPTPQEQPSTFFNSTPANRKLQTAQAELQACEAHLAVKERELDARRIGAVRDGLQTRFHALSECGQRWTQIGKDVGVYLYGQPSIEERRAIAAASPRPIFTSVISSPPLDAKPLPLLDHSVIHTPIPIRPSLAPETVAIPDDISHSSLTPSQSASQVGSSPSPATNHIYSNLEAQYTSGASASASERATSPTTSTSLLQRHVLPHRITEEDINVRASSENQRREDSSDDEQPDEPIRVVVNPRYKGGISNHDIRFGRSPSPGSATSSPRISRKSSGFLGSIRGLFSKQGKDGSERGNSVGGDDDDLRGRSKKKRKPLFPGGKKNKWETRIDGNILELTRDTAVLDVRPFPTRRVSEDSPQAARNTPSRRLRVVSESTPTKRVKKMTLESTLTEEDEAAMKRRRRRSASLDVGDLQQNRLSRAEEWVDDQKQVQPEVISPPGRKASVNRRKSVKKAAEADTSPPSSATATPGTLLHASTSSKDDVYVVPVTLEGGGASLSRSPSVGSRSSSVPRSGPVKSKRRRNSSLDQTHDSAIVQSTHSASTAKTQRRSSSPVMFSGNGTQPSLLSIVENVSKANREAWDSAAQDGNKSAQSVGTVKPLALVEMEVVKAPKSITLKDLETINVGGTIKANPPSISNLPKATSSLVNLEIRAGSTHSLVDLPATPTTSQTKNHTRAQTYPTQRAPSPSSLPRKQVLPLKSALKGGSRTPSPAMHNNTSPPPPIAQVLLSPPTHIHPSPTGQQAPPPIPSTSATQPVTSTNGIIPHHDDDEDSDGASISSYETGQEGIGDSSGEETETEPAPTSAHTHLPSTLPPPPPEKPQTHIVHDIALTVPIPNGGSSDISGSSTEVGVLTEADEKPRRRKSVRVSLRPQFSVTPPAIEDEDEEPSWEPTPQVSTPSVQQKRGYRDGDDMWKNSSDEEDTEYASARKLLMRRNPSRIS